MPLNKADLAEFAPALPHDSPFLIHTIQANSGELIGAYELGKRTLTVRSEFNGAIVAVTLSGERGGAGDTVYIPAPIVVEIMDFLRTKQINNIFGGDTDE